VSLTLGLLATALGLLLIWLTARSVTRPIVAVADLLKDIVTGEGDLTRRLNYAKQDELGVLAGWFDRFLDKLQPIIAEVKRAVGDTRATADQSLALASQTSDGMQRQFREVDMLATAAQEMSATAQDVGSKAARAAGATRGFAGRARGDRSHHRGVPGTDARPDQRHGADAGPVRQQRTDRHRAGSDPRHCRADQPAGAQRGHRGGAGRRGGARFRGGGRRGARPGAAHPGVGGGNPDGDRNAAEGYP